MIEIEGVPEQPEVPFLETCDFCEGEGPLVGRLRADPDQHVCQICHDDPLIPTTSLPDRGNKPLYWCGDPPSKCDIGGEIISNVFVDGKTKLGPWGFMCVTCHSRYGYGLGIGKGQIFQKQSDGRWLKTGG